MKDHVFRESVNSLRDLANQYAGTQQLREQMAYWLRGFIQELLKGEPRVGVADHLSTQLLRIANGGVEHAADAEALVEAALLLSRIGVLQPVGKVLSEEEMSLVLDGRISNIRWTDVPKEGELFQLSKGTKEEKRYG